jgi:subtilisin family serine protease
MTRILRVLVVFSMLAAVVSAGSAASGPSSTYVVVFKAGVGDVSAAANSIARTHGGQVGFVYQHALKGFSINVPARAAAAIAANPQVAYVEAEREYKVAAQDVPTGVRRIFADHNTSIDIDGTDKRVDVDVAIIDTGIDLDHPDLNVVASTNCASGGPFTRSCGSGGDDGNGHGTHVAGTVAALDNSIGVVGVAPGARLWAVKVLSDSGSGYTTWILAGLDYVAANSNQIEVGNMSLGGGFSQSLNDGVEGVVNRGVTMVVAAGNSDANAANYSPASEPTAITVSALADFNGEPGGGATATCRADVDDTFADFSNWGSVVDIIAPGVCILSTVNGGGYATFSGTSMASPHVAGAAALLRSRGLSHSTTESTLKDKGNFNWSNADDGDSIKEPLLDVSDSNVFAPVFVGGGGGGGTNNPPTASFTYSCSGLTCSFNGSGSSDSDGTIASYSWNFGDGTTGSGATVSKTYGSGGTYNVTLTVTDDDGATGSTSQSVTVSSGSGGITVTGSATSQGSTWSAIVTVSGLTSGGSISGTWNIGGTPNGCTDTNSDGVCSFTRTGIAKRVGSATWTASSGQSVTIAKP